MNFIWSHNNKDFVLVIILSEVFECDHAQVFSSSDLTSNEDFFLRMKNVLL